MAAYRHILVAVGLSSRSRHTVAEALVMARAFRARLTVLHVSRASLDEEARADRLAQLAELLPLSATDLKAHVDVVHGNPVREMLAFAEAHDVDLIVVGNRARGAVAKAFLESLGEQIGEKARCSILAVGGTDEAAPPPTVSRILCGVDFADSSDDTVDAAVSIAAATGSNLTLLHVIDPWRWAEVSPLPPDGVGEACAALEQANRERLSALLSSYASLKLDAHVAVTFGIATARIAHEARDLGADLLVLGAHSRRLLGLNLLGLTAQTALDEAPCPILLARTPHREGHDHAAAHEDMKDAIRSGRPEAPPPL